MAGRTFLTACYLCLLTGPSLAAQWEVVGASVTGTTFAVDRSTVKRVEVPGRNGKFIQFWEEIITARGKGPYRIVDFVVTDCQGRSATLAETTYDKDGEVTGQFDRSSMVAVVVSTEMTLAVPGSMSEVVQREVCR